MPINSIYPPLSHSANPWFVFRTPNGSRHIHSESLFILIHGPFHFSSHSKCDTERRNPTGTVHAVLWERCSELGWNHEVIEARPKAPLEGHTKHSHEWGALKTETERRGKYLINDSYLYWNTNATPSGYYYIVHFSIWMDKTGIPGTGDRVKKNSYPLCLLFTSLLVKWFKKIFF